MAKKIFIVQRREVTVTHLAIMAESMEEAVEIVNDGYTVNQDDETFEEWASGAVENSPSDKYSFEDTVIGTANADDVKRGYIKLFNPE